MKPPARRPPPPSSTSAAPSSSPVVVNVVALHDARMDALLHQRDVELPDMLALLTRFDNVLSGTDEMTDAMANLVFKDHELLRNYRAKEKFRRKRANGEISSASNRSIPVDDTLASEHNITDEAFAMLESVAKEHLNRLRRLKGKSGTRLTLDERFRIAAFVSEKRAWCCDVESGRELLEYVFETRELMSKYETEMRKVAAYVSEEEHERYTHDTAQRIEFLPPQRPLLLTNNNQDDNNTDNEDEDKDGDGDDDGEGKEEEDNDDDNNDMDDDDGDAHMMSTSSSSSSRNTLEDIIIESDVYRTLTDLQGQYFSLNNIRDHSTLERLNVRKPEIPMCPTCHIELVVEPHAATQTCTQCGVSERYVDLSFRSVPYNDTFNAPKARSSYEKRSYYEKWVKQVSGALNGQVPDEVWSRLYRECVARKWKVVTKQMIRQLLKRFHLSEYYIYAFIIANEFNGIPLVRFSPDEKAALDGVFEEALVLFEACPQHIKRRSNFISYSYFFYQACSLLGFTEYCPIFKLLSGPDYLQQHNRIWRWMCEHHMPQPWKFCPTTF